MLEKSSVNIPSCSVSLLSEPGSKCGFPVHCLNELICVQATPIQTSLSFLPVLISSTSSCVQTQAKIPTASPNSGRISFFSVQSSQTANYTIADKHPHEFPTSTVSPRSFLSHNLPWSCQTAPNEVALLPVAASLNSVNELQPQLIDFSHHLTGVGFVSSPSNPRLSSPQVVLPSTAVIHSPPCHPVHGRSYQQSAHMGTRGLSQQTQPSVTLITADLVRASSFPFYPTNRSASTSSSFLSPRPPTTQQSPVFVSPPFVTTQQSDSIISYTNSQSMTNSETENYEKLNIVYSDAMRQHLPANCQLENMTPEDATLPAVSTGYASSPAMLTASGLVDGVSSFIRTSFTDVPLGELEETLGRLSINDNYVGPLRLTSSLESSEKTEATVEAHLNPRSDPYLLMPFSKSSLAFVPPGVMVVTEVWDFFGTERLSFCNHHIFSMKYEHLRKCLHKHNLNQLGTSVILRRRLQEFVRRLRESPVCMRGASITNIDEVLDEFQNATEQLFPALEGSLNSSESSSSAAGIESFPMMKLTQPVVLTPDAFYAYLLIIDLEATCDGKPRQIGGPEFPHEIIEFPILLYDTRQRKCVSVFHSYCRPKLKPNLSKFCTALTQISQTQVDSAVTFPTLLAQLENWLLVQNSLSEQRCAIVCDCSADMAKFMRMQCQLSRISMPSWARTWINLSKAFRQFYRLPPKHRVTLSTMLDDLELSFVGQQHRGLDDAMNILRVVQILLADGCRLRVNERVDAGRPPSYAASVPRLVAESACGIMGSKLALTEKRSKSATYYTPSSTPHPPVSPIVNEPLTESDRDALLWLHSVQKKRVNRPNMP